VKAIAGRVPRCAQIKRWLHIPVLWDLEARLRMMSAFPGTGYPHLVAPTSSLAPHDQSPELARLANDGMAEIVAKHPSISRLRRLAPDETTPRGAARMERAIEKLGARAPDLHQRERPAARRAGVLSDLRAHGRRSTTCRSGVHRAHREIRRLHQQSKSKYEIYWLFGWPYETSVFMARLGVLGNDGEAPRP